MKAEQVSFAAGEISPLLHARVDLSRYRTALSELVNMIVLPQGGVTRRAGINSLSATVTQGGVRLIPFEYNTTDSVMLEFQDKNMRVWRKYPSSYTAAARIDTPYALADVKDLRYVQSGNVMFLTHKDYKPQMLRRNSLTSWTMTELNIQGGPWIAGEEWAPGTQLRLSGAGDDKDVYSIGGDIFTSGLAGTLLKVEYAADPKFIELESSESPDRAQTEPFEVKGTLNVTTSGEWTGVITVDRSANGGISWVTVRQYVRKDTETQGQWDFTLSETEENILYRVTAQHEKAEASGGSGTSPVVRPADIDPSVKIYSKFGDWLYDKTACYIKNGGTDYPIYYNPDVDETFYVTGVDEDGDMIGYYVKGNPENLSDTDNDNPSDPSTPSTPENPSDPEKRYMTIKEWEETLPGQSMAGCDWKMTGSSSWNDWVGAIIYSRDLDETFYVTGTDDEGYYYGYAVSGNPEVLGV